MALLLSGLRLRLTLADTSWTTTSSTILAVNDDFRRLLFGLLADSPLHNDIDDGEEDDRRDIRVAMATRWTFMVACNYAWLG